jgi:hypothetical protein
VFIHDYAPLLAEIAAGLALLKMICTPAIATIADSHCNAVAVKHCVKSAISRKIA